MVPLVAVSGSECVEALTAAGFSRATSAAGVTNLRKDLRYVTIPDTDMLTPEELMSILRDANVPYADFLDLMSEAPTDPAISRTVGRSSSVRPSSLTFRTPPERNR